MEQKALDRIRECEGVMQAQAQRISELEHQVANASDVDVDRLLQFVQDIAGTKSKFAKRARDLLDTTDKS